LRQLAEIEVTFAGIRLESEREANEVAHLRYVLVGGGSAHGRREMAEGGCGCGCCERWREAMRGQEEDRSAERSLALRLEAYRQGLIPAGEEVAATALLAEHGLAPYTRAECSQAAIGAIRRAYEGWR
jgi:hypothetical protein